MRFGMLQLVVLLAATLSTFAWPGDSLAAASRPEPQRRAQKASRPARAPRVDYTKFSHRTPSHQQSCGSCHKFPSPNWKEAQPGDDAIPDVTEYPEHASCLKCHRTQFFAKERPAPKICSVCHVGVTPRFTARHPFPNPVAAFLKSGRAKEFTSGFAIAFPHDKHLELFARSTDPLLPSHGVRFVRAAYGRQETAQPNASCANCHSLYQPAGESNDDYATKPPATFDGDSYWLKKGTFMASNISHATCFACHSLDSGMKPDPTDCAMCHKLMADPVRPSDFDPALVATMNVSDPLILKMWRKRDDSATFRHEGGLHAEVGCTTCHDVAATDAGVAPARKVRTQSCGGDMGCHITATADEGGALTFEILQRQSDPKFQCVKCHLAYGKSVIPATHATAISGAKTE